jgi:hypothetical protein
LFFLSDRPPGPRKVAARTGSDGSDGKEGGEQEEERHMSREERKVQAWIKRLVS